MDPPPVRRKRKLLKQKQYDPTENSPDIDVPVPGSETLVSPSACDSPSFHYRKRASPVTVGTPKIESRTRQYAKPLNRPSENFAERLNRVIDNDDEFLSKHLIVPTLDDDDSRIGNNDENEPPRTDEQPRYNVIPRKVNGGEKGKRKLSAHARLMDKKLVDTTTEVIVRPVHISKPSSSQAPPSPSTSISSDDEGLAALIPPEPPVPDIAIPISARASEKLNDRTRLPRRSVRLEYLRRRGLLEWTCEDEEANNA
ncbi:hypothetical protein BJV82DRAFT_79857 [Fennellomyces sp. T-0311]|nr:hypothetical protein BJV82DRAFT_79857 [Fennellomyces sp. T-0311]